MKDPSTFEEPSSSESIEPSSSGPIATSSAVLAENVRNRRGRNPKSFNNLGKSSLKKKAHEMRKQFSQIELENALTYETKRMIAEKLEKRSEKVKNKQ